MPRLGIGWHNHADRVVRVRVLFELSDPDDADGFFLEISESVRKIHSTITLVPFHCDANREETQLDASIGVESFKITTVQGLPLTPATIDLGVAFRSSPGYESTRFLCMKMLNRMDFSGTFRGLEREILFQQSVMFAIQTLMRIRPSLLVFQVTPHEFLPFILSKVADFLGIEVLHFQPCSVAPVVFPRFSSSQKASLGPFLLPGTRIADFVEVCANRGLNSLAERSTPGYIKSQMARDKFSSGSLSHIRAVWHSIKWLFVDRFPNGVDFSGHLNQSSFRARIVKILLSRSLALTLRSKIRDQGGELDLDSPFALFALHYEPERTSIPDGLPVDHQADAVMDIRALFPSQLRLLVKEHYSQQSSALRGYLGRSPSFYDLIERFPNTALTPFAADSVQLIEGATCVVTLTGTIGIEAALAGTPAIYFGAPWWAGMPGAVRRSELESYAELTNISMPDRGSVMAFLVNRIMNEGIPGLGSESLSNIEERFGRLPEGFRKAEADALSQLICSFAH